MTLHGFQNIYIVNFLPHKYEKPLVIIRAALRYIVAFLSIGTDNIAQKRILGLMAFTKTCLYNCSTNEDSLLSFQIVHHYFRTTILPAPSLLYKNGNRVSIQFFLAHLCSVK